MPRKIRRKIRSSKFDDTIHSFYSEAKARSFTPPNLLDFISEEKLSYDWSWSLWWKPIGFVCFLHGIALSLHSVAFAQVPDESADVIDRIDQLDTRSLSAGFDTFWIDTMPSWLFLIRVSLGFLGFFAVVWFAADLLSKADTRGHFPAEKFVVPVAVLGLITGSGDLMATMGMSVRDVLNDTGRDVLQLVGAQSEIEQAQTLKSYPALLSSQVKQCEGQPPGQAQQDCFRAAGEAAERVVAADRERFGNTSWLERQQENIGNIASGAFQAAENSGALNFFPIVTGAVNGDIDLNPITALASGIEEGLMIVLDAMTEGFQFIVESAYLLTTLLLPVSLLLAFSPLQAMAPIGWISSMVAIGSIKFMYNVVIAIGADLMIQTDGEIYFVFGMITAILAPIIAVLLAGGGGGVFILGVLQFSSQAVNARQGE